jgi:cell division protein FtsI (penicillin-binding protein 3)
MDFGSNNYDEEYFRNNVDSLSICLARIFKDRSKKEYKHMMEQGWEGRDRYLLLKRNVTYQQLKEIRRFPIYRLGRFKGGLVAVEKTKREFPFQILASRTVGFVRQNYKVGIEGGYSEYLEGVSGKRLMRKLSNGGWMPVSNKNEVEPKDGYDVVTTIDINIQDVAEESLRRTLETNEADHGCAVLMEVATGHVVAIANLTRMADGSYQEVMNYAIAEAAEPGSTFKLPSMMVALEDGKLRLTDTIDTEDGDHYFCDQLMRDSHKGGYGRISAQKVFEQSSNVGVSKIINRAYTKEPEKFIEGLYRMGLGKPLGLEIPGEAKPKIKNTTSKVWTDCYSLAWMSVGYELAITPIQTLCFYNAVANNGKMMKPIFVKEIQQNGQTIRKFDPVVLNKAICSEETVKNARQMVEGVVSNGTAKHLFNAVYKIAGKTGTAQIASSEGYNHENYKASFVGYFPADNPRYSCIVVVTNPTKGAYYGGKVAAPVFKEIADKVYATRLDIHQAPVAAAASIDIPMFPTGNQKDIEYIYRELNYQFQSPDPSALWLGVTKDSSSQRLVARHLYDGLVPDVTGMKLKDALYMLEKAGLKAKPSGKGIIRRQNPLPGEPCLKKTTVTLELASN